MKRISAFLLALLFTLILLPSFGSADASGGQYDYVRVKLSTNNASTLLIYVTGKYYIKENGMTVEDTTLGVTVQSDGTLRVTHSQLGNILFSESLNLLRADMNRTAGYLRVNSRRYLGHFSVGVDSGKTIRIINTVPMAHYLYGVVGYEMNNSYPPEALKAQALAAKGYVITSLKPSSSLYDIGDTSSQQVYKGYDPKADKVIGAVDSTINEVVTYNGTILKTFYAASNGGETTLPSYAWSSSFSNNGYAITLDPYDFENTLSPCEKVFIPITSGTMSANLRTLLIYKAQQASGQLIDDIVSISSVDMDTPMYNGVTRNLTRINIELIASYEEDDGSGSTQTEFVPLNISIAVNELLSFNVVTNGSLRVYWGENTNGGYTIYHCRWGHGVGLSQRGAQQRAANAHSYRDIIAFYYPGASISTINVNPPQNPTPPSQSPTPSATPGNSASPTPASSTSPTPTPTPTNGAEGQQPVAYGTVTGNGVNFRKGPSTDTDILTVRYRGAKLTILEVLDGWYKAIEPSGLTGYISSRFVEITSTVTPSPTPGGTTAPDSTPSVTPSPTSTTGVGSVTAFGVINKSGVNFRVGPGTNYNIIATLKSGEFVNVISETNGWYCAVIRGMVGYVSKQYVTITGYPSISPTPGTSTSPSPTDSAQLKRGIITKNGVNFRKGPSTSFESMGKLNKNTSLIIYNKVDEWYYVRVGDKMGYVHSDYVKITGDYSEGGGSSLPSGATGLGKTTGNVNFRTGPGKTYDVIQTLKKGTELTLYSQKDGWYEAEYNGKRGYVSGKYIEILMTVGDQHGGEDDGDNPVEGLGTGITTGKVNFRTKPSTQSTTITQLPRNTEVTLISLNDGWYKAEYNGKTGYLYAKYVRLIGNSGGGTPPENTPEPVPDELKPAEGKTTGKLNLRKSASKSATIIETMPRDTKVVVLGEHGDWYYVLHDGKSGYVSKAYLKIISSGNMGIAKVDDDCRARDAYASANVNMRTQPNTSGTIVIEIKRGAEFTAYFKLNGWYLIRYNGKWGYASADYVKLK